MHPSNLTEDYVYCPYCGQKESFAKSLRIWVVSDQVNFAFEESKIDECLRRTMGGFTTSITPMGDGHMIMLEFDNV
jgi:hypothetical protein